MIRVVNIPVGVDYTEDDLRRSVANLAGIDASRIVKLEVRKRSIDARGRTVKFVVTAHVEVRDEENLPRRPHVEQIKPPPPVPDSMHPIEVPNKPEHPVVVVGAGPGGLLAAWQLARAGVSVRVLDRGTPTHERARAVAEFSRHGVLDPDSNVLFGEGGAGTFSDGKLYTRTKDARNRVVWHLFVKMGASPDILVDAHPHIGTDKLRRVIPNLRGELERMGARFQFHAHVTDLQIRDERVRGVVLADGTEIRTDHVILAAGHSARDTYAMLHAHGVEMESMPFALGVRVEHPQHLIDVNQYGRFAGHPRLGAAPYRLTYNGPDRSSYSFCMCPGGQIIGSTHEEGTVVTNGMSASGRSGRFANAGLVVNVTPEDYATATPSPLDGIEYQRRWERAAYQLGGGGFRAPAQRVRDFLHGVATTQALESTYLPGITPTDLSDCLPDFVHRTLRSAIREFAKKIKNFDGPEGVLVGVESRVSAPLRIPRRPDGQSLSVAGLYPVGEGAGFAGGITSAAVDGLEAATRLLDNVVHG